MANIDGTNNADILPGTIGDDRIDGKRGDDNITGLSGDDILIGAGGDDILDGGADNDDIDGGGGDDTVNFDVVTGGRDRVDLGDGDDQVNVTSAGVSQIRLTFTSAEVGNGLAVDGGAMANQDGALAVRLQAEDGSGARTGEISRFDDEGITFTAAAGSTFDVRDLVSGAARGDQFDVVSLGTADGDKFNEVGETARYYINGGGGHDTINGGVANDFLVGGAGDDVLNGRAGADSFIGGGGADSIVGGAGSDLAIFDVVSGGADSVNLAAGDDNVNVSGAGVSQVRLTFTSAEVGNRDGDDSNTMLNQDGDLAVRLQAEDGADATAGAVSRFDDEGITFRAAAGTTFDVRDLVSGTARGDQFNVVALGTEADDVFAENGETDAYYINGGRGADDIRTGEGADFLVGGDGADILFGNGGADSFIGGAGTDTLRGGEGADSFIFASLEAGQAARIGDLQDIDTINLSGIDADATAEGNQAFTLVGKFSGTAGEATLEYDATVSDNTRLSLDVDGDGDADMTIILANGDQTDFSNFVL